MSSRVIHLVAALYISLLPCSTFAQTRPTTAAATQPTVQVSPEVQALIPLVREGERLYKDVELSYRYTLRSTGPAPENNVTIERTGTYIHSDSHWYADSIESISSKRSGPSEYHTVASWDGQFNRLFMEDLRKDDRAASISLGLPSASSPDPMSPFFPFCIDISRSLPDHFAKGLANFGAATQRITRLADTDYLNHRCARIQIALDAPADGAVPARQETWTWHLLADAHYLPVKAEGVFRLPDGKQVTMIFEAADLQEIAPGIFYPTEVTQPVGDAKFGKVTTWTYDHVSLHPDLPADKLTNIPIPPSTLLMARKEGKPIARAKTDTHWTLKSAAAFLLDPTTTTQPAPASQPAR